MKINPVLTALAKSHVVCPRCEAPLNKACVTMSGRPTEMHTARVSPLLQAYAQGYDDATSSQ